jgi:hypothetical protein
MLSSPVGRGRIRLSALYPLQERPGFVVGYFVGVVRRAVACRQPTRFLGVFQRRTLVPILQRHLCQKEVHVRPLQHIAATFGDDQRFLRPEAGDSTEQLLAGIRLS